MPVCLCAFEEGPFGSREHIEWHVVINLRGLKEYEVAYAHKYKARCMLVGVPTPSPHAPLDNQQTYKR